MDILNQRISLIEIEEIKEIEEIEENNSRVDLEEIDPDMPSLESVPPGSFSVESSDIEESEKSRITRIKGNLSKKLGCISPFHFSIFSFS